MTTTHTHDEFRIEAKNPASDGGLTDWHYFCAAISLDDAVKRLRNLRTDFTGASYEFRLRKRSVTTSASDWIEVPD